MDTMVVHIPKNYGALLLGGLIATGLSGIVLLQAVLYFKVYARDDSRLKALVVGVWILDSIHTGLIWASLWDYLIENFGDQEFIESIPLSLSLTIVFTAVSIFLVHCFFAQRILRLSMRNWYITAPIIVLALGRLATCGYMIELETYVMFKEHVKWIFSLGLALSSAVDVLITLSMFALLRINRSKSLSLTHIIDALILYAFEIGILTTTATIASMISWLTMSDNLIFMGLHFVISKLYANSLLATLNMRHGLRRSRDRGTSDEVWSGRPNPRLGRGGVINVDGGLIVSSKQSQGSTSGEIPLRHVHINVEKSVHYDDDADAGRNSPT